MKPTLAFNVVITVVIVFISMGGAVVVVVRRNEIAHTLGVSEFCAAMFYAVFFVGVAVGGYAIPRLVDAKSRWRLVFYVSTFSTFIGSLICWYSANIIVFALAFSLFIAVMGAAPMLTVLVSRLDNWMPYRPALSIAIPTISLLAAFGPWRKALSLFDAAERWQNGFLLLAAGAVVQMILVSGLIEIEATGHPSPVFPKEGPSSLKPSALPFAASLFFVTVGSTLLINILREIELSSGIGYDLFSLFSVSAFVGRISLAMWFDRGFYQGTLFASAGLVVLSCLLFAVGGSAEYALFIASLSIGTGYAGYLPAVIAYVRNFCRGRHTTMLLAIGAAGVAIGAIFAGTVPHFMQYQIAVIIALFCGIIALGLLISQSAPFWNRG